MIIYPKVALKDATVETLSRRNIIITADGFAGVIYGGKIHYIDPTGEIIFSDFPINQKDFYSANDADVVIKYVSSHENAISEKLIIPENLDLFELSSMGLDAAVICLRINSRSSDEAKSLYERSVLLRPRYKKLQNLTFSEASEYYQKIQMLDPVIRHLDSRYFSYPFGSGHFHGNLQKSKSFTIDQYLTQTFEDLMLPNTIKKTTYVKYLNKNIFMQNCLKQEAPDFFIEGDRLDYDVFSAETSSFNHWPRELKNTISPWTTQTKRRFNTMAKEVIYRVCRSNQYTNRYTEYMLEKHAKNLSIFCASAFCNDAGDKRRVKQLFNAGARQLGHLAALA